MVKELLPLGLLLVLVAACSTAAAPAPPFEGERVESCPVSTPNVSVSPHNHFISTQTGFQNAAGTLFTNLPLEGRLILDGESVRPDGSLGPIILFSYLEGVFGELEVAGERLDASAPGLEAEFVNSSRTAEGPTGPQETRIVFPSEGCWEITLSTASASLTFVVAVLSDSGE